MVIPGLQSNYATQNSYYQTVEKRDHSYQTTAEAVKESNTEPSFQIGGQSFTQKEWDKLLKQFDAIEEAIRKEQKERLDKEDTQNKHNKTETDVTPLTNTTSEEEIADSAIEALLSESSKCTYPSTEQTDKKTWYITSYTQDGIWCKKCDKDGSSEDLWKIDFTEDGQYEKVMDFLKRFEQEDNLTFACHENFWNDFLEDKIEEEEFVKFFQETNHGIPDYSITIGDSMYIDKEKAKYAPYMNRPGDEMMTAEEMQAKVDALIRENQKARMK